MIIRKKLVFVLLIVFTGFGLAAESINLDNISNFDNINIKVAIIGPDDPLYSWWGHVSLIIEDTITEKADSYDYGSFSFNQENFISNFIMGRLYFLKVRNPADRVLKYNKYLNRDITIYTLYVSNENKKKLIEFLNKDVLPENRIYLYDHFYDNCSTRIRDEMDIITDGQFSKKYKVVSDHTLRSQLRRFTYSYRFMDWLLNFAIGGMADKPATEYEGMFLPKELGLGIEKMRIKNDDGTTRPFIIDKEIYYKAEGRVSIPEKAKPRWPLGLITGLLLGLIATLCLKNKKSTAIFSSIVSLIIIIPSSLLFFLSFFTNHSCTYNNMNLIVMNPAFIVVFILSIKSIVGKTKSLRSMQICWTVETLLIVVSFLIKVIPVCRQDNVDNLLILLPMSVAMSLIPSFLKKWKIEKFCLKDC